MINFIVFLSGFVLGFAASISVDFFHTPVQEFEQQEEKLEDFLIQKPKKKVSKKVKKIAETISQQLEQAILKDVNVSNKKVKKK